MKPRSRFSPWLCAAALGIGCLATPALAAPFSTTYTGQLWRSSFPEITSGESYSVTFVFDNGGNTTNTQTWTAAHLTCTIWRMNNARNVVYAQDLVATPPSTRTGTAVSDASGGLTGMFSELNQGVPGISAGYTSTGMVLSPQVGWFANLKNPVFLGSTGAFGFDDRAGGLLMAPVHWTAPQPFTDSCAAISITPTTVAAGVVGAAYSQTMSVTPMVGALTWSATGLPAGLTLDTGTGVISGTPTASTAAPASVVVTVTDSSAPTPLTASQTLSLTVAAAPVAAAPTPVPTLGEWGLVLLSLLAAALGMGTLRRRGALGV